MTKTQGQSFSSIYLFDKNNYYYYSLCERHSPHPVRRVAPSLLAISEIIHYHRKIFARDTFSGSANPEKKYGKLA